MTDAIKGGVYVSKTVIGVFTSILTAILFTTAGNLIYLNRAVLKFESHMEDVKNPNAVLGGALPRSEFVLERRLIDYQLGELRTIAEANSATNKEILRALKNLDHK